MHIEFKENEAPKGLQLAMQKLSLKSEKKKTKNANETPSKRIRIELALVYQGTPMLMVVKIPIWILRSYDFTISPTQNDLNLSRIFAVVQDR